MNQPIPVDQRIVDAYFQLDSQRGNKGAAWLFGMIATYGIKPEDLNSFDWGQNGSLVLHNKKRPVNPLHPQWVFLFNLQKKRPCEMQDRVPTLLSQLYRLMAHQAIDVNVTDLLLAHSIRKKHYRNIKRLQPSSPVYAGVS
jgi:hypothetical protein